MDNDEVRALFRNIFGDRTTTDQTIDILNKAERLYFRVSNQKAITNGKGFSLGGAAQRLGEYAGMDWDSIDGKLGAIFHNLQEGMDRVVSQLKESDDPDDYMVLQEIEGDRMMHLIRNISYHSFWIGYFTREVGGENLTSIDEKNLDPVQPTPDDVMDVAKQASFDAAVHVATMLMRAESDELPDDYTYEGISLETVKSLGEAVKKSSEEALQLEAEQIARGEEPSDISVHAMNVFMGIIIGRALERQFPQ